MRASALGHIGIEMSGDPHFLPRVRRLASVSSVALGVIWLLAMWTTEPHNAAIDGALLAGWILMPIVLLISLRRPEMRALVLVPSALVTTGLVALCLTALPGDYLIRVGWFLVTGGILFGGVLGGWFWFRWFPVPPSLDAPFSSARWILIGLHVMMIMVGIALVGLSYYL